MKEEIYNLLVEWFQERDCYFTELHVLTGNSVINGEFDLHELAEKLSDYCKQKAESAEDRGWWAGSGI